MKVDPKDKIADWVQCPSCDGTARINGNRCEECRGNPGWVLKART